MTTTEKVDVYQVVTDKVLAALEAGTVPWHKPWSATDEPLSMATNKAYRGINPFLLSMTAAAKGYVSPFWGTYKGIASLGGQVRKGEKGTIVVFWKRLPPREIKDEITGKVETRSPMFLRHYSVFNAEQADNLPAAFTAVPEIREHDTITEAETLAAGYFGREGSPSLILGGDMAYYRPSADMVNVPILAKFESPEAYYSTLFHEATHSTGHASRLARKDLMETHRFGDASYSREELVAEMGAAMLCGTIGIEQTTVPQSAAYIANWLSVLRGDKKLVVSAAAQAQKACDLIRGISWAESEES